MKKLREWKDKLKSSDRSRRGESSENSESQREQASSFNVLRAQRDAESPGRSATLYKPEASERSRYRQERAGSFDVLRDQRDTMRAQTERAQTYRYDAQRWRDISTADDASTHEISTGYQGSSQETLDKFLQHVLEKIDMDNYQSIGELHRNLYELYTGYDSSAGSNISAEQQQQHEQSLKNIQNYSEEQHGSLSFYNGVGKSWNARYSINAKPDRIAGITQSLVEKYQSLPCVAMTKAMKSLRYAEQQADNIVITYNDRDESKHFLHEILSSFKEYTRSGHPPMMKPFRDDMQGIAYADQPDSNSFGNERTEAMAVAIDNLKQAQVPIDFDTLRTAVKEQFQIRGINPDSPEEHLYYGQ